MSGPILAGRGSFSLHYGNALSPLVRIVADGVQADMWRMSWPDGRLSDLANLSRIKDAAVAICERGPPARDRRRLNWKQNRLKTTVAVPPMRSTAHPLSEAHPA